MGNPHPPPNGNESVSMRKPPKYRLAATVNCTASFSFAFAPWKSSYTPSAKINVAPANTQATVRQLLNRFWLTSVPSHGVRINVTKQRNYQATPPSLGVVCL